MAKGIKAVGYVRVSTAGQADTGLSLREQSERINDFIKRQGWEFVCEYRDAGKSARKDYRTRPEFVAMLQDAAAGKFNRLVCYDISRSFRNSRDYHNVKEDLGAHGVEIVTLDMPNFDATDAAQDFSRTVLVGAAELVAKQSREKSIQVRQSKLERGEYNIGQRIPFGLRWTDKAGHGLEHDPKTLPVWLFIKELRSQGNGYGRIAAILNGDEYVDKALCDKYETHPPVLNRYGKKVWHESTISSIFADETRVTGKHSIRFRPVKGPERLYIVSFPPLLTRSEFDTFKAMARKNLTWVPRNVGHGSVLSGLCVCGVCGSTLHVTGYREYKYYGCAKKLRRQPGQRSAAHGTRQHVMSKRCSLPLIRAEALEREVFRQLGDFFSNDEVFDKALDLARGITTPEELTAEQARLDAAYRKLDQKEQHLADALVDALISKDAAQNKRQELDRERARLDKRLADLHAKQAALDHNVDHIKRVEGARLKYLRRLHRLEGLAAQEKQDLLRSLLPVGSDSRIVVRVVDARTPNDPENPEPLGTVYIEMTGLLPLGVEAPVYTEAVLGGALAVP